MTSTTAAPTSPDFTELTLATERNGTKSGTFRHDGHVITVAVNVTDQGRYNRVRACSDTHPSLTRVLADVGTLAKVGVGRYELREGASRTGYTDRGTVAALAERLARYSLG